MRWERGLVEKFCDGLSGEVDRGDFFDHDTGNLGAAEGDEDDLTGEEM